MAMHKLVETQTPAEVHEAGELHFDEVHIERTTPQGTQEHGVEHGHENRDVVLAPLLRWFAGLAVGTAIVFVAMWGMFNVMDNIAKSKDILPPLFNTQQAPPKDQPRLLPNPSQGPNDPKLPWEVGAAERLSEDQQLKDAGMADIDAATHSTRAKLPGDALSIVAAEQPKNSSNATQPMLDQIPSQASGGTQPEGRLR